MRSRKLSPGCGRDADDDLVGEDARAAGDRGAVAAGLADHRRRLAGDRRLVDAGDALDHSPSAGITSPAETTTSSPTAQRRARDVLERCRRRGGGARPSRRASCAASSACALPRPSAIASAKFANSTVNQSQTATSQAKTRRIARSRATVDEDAADLDDEHDRVARHPARVELERRCRRAARSRIVAVEQRARCVAQRVTGSEVLDDRPEREDGEVGQPDDDQDDADEQRRRRAACRSGTCRPTAGTGCLRASEPASASSEHDQQEAADEHRQAEGRVVPVGVPGQAAEGRAVVVRRRGEGVEDLGEPVRPGLRIDDVARVEHDRDAGEPRISERHDQDVERRRASSRSPGSSCRGTPACARPSGRR